MRTHFLLVSNSTAGRGRQERIDAVVKELVSRGCSVTPLNDDRQSLLDNKHELEKFDAVIAAGGDGTVRRLLTTEAGRSIPLGIIPNGTGNVLAHEIALRLRPSLIADVLIAGPEIVVHSGRAGAEPFLLMVGLGFDGCVINRLNHSLKIWLGKAAYGPAVLWALCKRQPQFQISIDGTDYTAGWVVVANVRHYGGGFRMAPNAGLTRRPFEVVVFHSSSRWVRMRQLLALATGQIESAPQMTVVSGRDIRIKGPRADLEAQADGDPLAICPDVIGSGDDVRLIVPNRFVR